MNKTTFKIVCINPYEFEGRKFARGEIGNHCFGRLIPKDWAKATEVDIKKWINKKR